MFRAARVVAGPKRQNELLQFAVDVVHCEISGGSDDNNDDDDDDVELLLLHHGRVRCVGGEQ